MYALIEDFLTRLEGATTQGETWEAIRRFFEGQGLDRINYGFASERDASQVTVFSTCPEDYMRYYRDQGYAAHDKGIRHCLNHLHPSYVGITAAPPGVNDASVQVSRDAADAGLRTGIVFPMRHGIRHAFAGMTIANNMDRPEFDSLIQGERKMVVHLAAMYAHGFMQAQLAKAAAEAVHLTPAERECLLWVSRGMSRKVIAYKLGKAPQTIDFHLGNAMKKLGAVNGMHAVARAVALGLICP